MELKPLSESEAARVADVFNEHRPFVESVARRFAPSPQDVPDIVQAVGVQLCRGLGGFRAESKITTWLYRVTMNAARDSRRRERSQVLQARAALAEMVQPDQVLDPDQVVVDSQRRAALHRAIQQLRPGEQRAIRSVLNPSGVIGEKKPSKTSKHRAIVRLRTVLADEPRVKQ